MNSYQFEPLIIFLIIGWLIYLHGAYVSNLLKLKQQSIDRVFVNFILGFSLVIFVLFFVALFQLLYSLVVLILFLIIPTLYFYKVYKENEFRFSIHLTFKDLINHAWLIFIILYLILPYSYNLFFPEVGSDAMRYHLPYARFYAENHGLTVNEYLRYPVFSHNFNMVLALGYMFLEPEQGEVLARMFSLFSFVVLIIGVYSLVTRSLNKTTAVIACMIIVNVKIFKLLMISGYVDIGLTLFLFSSIYFLYMWQNDQSKPWLLLSACLLGIVIGTKYLGLLWLIPMGTWVFFANKTWKQTYQYILIALLIGSPWYIRNIFIAGNPLHPFLQDIFGYWIWTAEDIIRQKQDLLVKHGVDRTLINLFQLPYLLETHRYFSKINLGWFMVLGIPFLAFSLKMAKFYRFLAIFVLFNLVFWFYTSQIIRYLMGTLPFLAIFAAFPFGKLLNPLITNKWLQHKYINIVVSLSLIAYSSHFLYYKFHILDKWKPLPRSVLDWKAENFKKNKFYPFVDILNTRKAKRVYNISEGMLQNTFNGEVLGDWYGIANKRSIFKNHDSFEKIKKIMSKHNTHYLLVDKKKTWFNKVNETLSVQKQVQLVKETDQAILYYFD